MSCIQMKLDEAVTDTTLRKVDEWVLDVRSTANRHMEIHAYGSSTPPETIEVRVIGDGVLYTDSSYTTPIGKTTTLSAATTWHLYLGAGTYKVYLSNKYKLTYLASLNSGVDFAHSVGIDCKHLAYEEHWSTLDLNGVKLDNFEQFAIDKVGSFRLYNCGLNCDMSLFIDRIMPTTTLAKFIIDNDPTVTGDASDLGTIHAFVNSANGTVVSIRKKTADQNLTGTYTQFCDKLFAAGKTSGTLQVHMPEDPAGDGTYTITFSSSGWSRS